MKNTIVIILVMVIISACATASQKADAPPEWLNNPYATYPEQLYLASIGSGDSRAQAERNAAAKLAQIFETSVSVDETHRQRYKEITGSELMSFEDEFSMDRSVRLEAEQTLINITYADSYRDNMGKVHVLAYIHRMRTADIYENKIAENADKVNQLIAQSNNSGNQLIKYAAMNAAQAVANSNQILIDQLSIISPDSKEFLNLNYNMNSINQRVGELARDITFEIEIENDDNNQISILLSDMLNELGFMITTHGMLLIDGKIDFEETDLGRADGVVFVRYDLQLRVIDDYGNIIISMNERGREGHNNFREARQRCLRTIQQKIDQALQNRLISYFDNLVAS